MQAKAQTSASKQDRDSRNFLKKQGSFNGGANCAGSAASRSSQTSQVRATPATFAEPKVPSKRGRKKQKIDDAVSAVVEKKKRGRKANESYLIDA